MSDEGVLPDIRSSSHYQVILKVSYVFRSLLNPNILHLKTLMSLFSMFKYGHFIFLPTVVILSEVLVSTTVIHC